MGEYRIYITDIIYAIRKNYKYIISLSMAGLVIGILVYFAQTMVGRNQVSYVTKVAFAVNPEVAGERYANGGTAVNGQDIQMVNSMISTVVYICRSNTVTNRVVDELKLTGITGSQIGRALTAGNREGTQIVELSLNWTNRDEGEHILTKICEILPDVLQQTMKTGGIGIVNTPTTEEIRPITDKKTPLLITAFGMMMGFGICILPLFVRPTLISLSRVESILGIPRIGEVPESQFAGRIDIPDAASMMFKESYVSAAHIVMHQIRTQKTNCSSIYFTSAKDGEGKTTVVANLGLALSSIGIRVLLMDLDLNHPKLSSQFVDRITHKKTLNAVYYHEVEPEDAVIHINKRLDVLPTAFEVNPLGINVRLGEVVNKMTAMYDLVLIDSAPIGYASESLGLNRIADAIVFIAKFDDTPVSVLKYNIDKLNKSGAPILGCIVNEIPKAGITNAGMTGSTVEAEELENGQNIKPGRKKHIEIRKWRARAEKHTREKGRPEVEESYYKILNAVSSIESDRKENFLLEALINLEDILANRTISIYLIEGSGNFGRLAVSSKEIAKDAKPSIKLDDFKDIIREIGKNGVYSNSDLTNGLPMYAAGLIVNGKIEVLISIKTVSADQFNHDYLETIRMCCDVLQMMYRQIRKQEAALSNIDFEPDTGIMEAVRFRKLVETYISMSMKEVANFTLIKLYDVNKWNIYERLKGQIRTSDTLGYDEKGNIYLLLAHMDRDQIGPVKVRLANAGITDYEFVEELDVPETAYRHKFLMNDDEVDADGADANTDSKEAGIKESSKPVQPASGITKREPDHAAADSKLTDSDESVSGVIVEKSSGSELNQSLPADQAAEETSMNNHELKAMNGVLNQAQTGNGSGRLAGKKLAGTLGGNGTFTARKYRSTENSNDDSGHEE